MNKDVQISYSGGVSRRFRIGPVVLGFVTLFLIGTLLFFYLSQTNETVTRGYEIKGLEKRLKELKAENHNLELKAAELQSIERVEERTKKINMVKITGAHYIKLKKDELALTK